MFDFPIRQIKDSIETEDVNDLTLNSDYSRGRTGGYSFEAPHQFPGGGAGSSGHNRDPSQDRTRSYMRVSRDPTPEVEGITNSIPFASAWRRKMVEEDVIRLTQVSTSTSPNPGMVTT